MLLSFVFCDLPGIIVSILVSPALGIVGGDLIGVYVNIVNDVLSLVLLLIMFLIL
jgi:membrane protein DedA with SNARE-associated domain